MTHNAPHILIVDGYPVEDRKNLAECGMDTAGDLYAQMLVGICPKTTFKIVFPTDPGTTLPNGTALENFDGVAWTGSSLTVHDQTDTRVHRHIELAREAFRVGVPQYGTCWGIQIAAVAAGGTVAANPNGREMGVARKITLTPSGRGHDLYTDKPSTFDGYVSHFDEVTHVPPGSDVLAGNAFTRIQALSVHHDQGTFWGLQYHPEYDLHQMARLFFARSKALTKEGFFTDEANALSMVEDFERLHTAPDDKALAWQLGIESDLLVRSVRQTEPRNWLNRQVIANMG